MIQVDLFPPNLLEHAGRMAQDTALARYEEALLTAELEYISAMEWWHKPNSPCYQPDDMGYVAQYHPDAYRQWIVMAM